MLGRRLLLRPGPARDPLWSSVALSIPFNGPNGSTTIVDIKGHPITPSGAIAITTANPGAGGSSALFDGVNDAISVAHASDLVIGAGAFTIEWWEYKIANGGYQTYLSKGYAVAGGIVVQSGLNNGALVLYAGATSTVLASESATMPGGVWTHRAICREASGAIRIFRGGAVTGGGTSSFNFNSTASFIFGAGSSTGINNYFLSSQVEGFRMTIGQARYVNTFTPPPPPFPTF